MSGVSSPKLVKTGGSMVAKPVNVRVNGLWVSVQNVTAELYQTADSGTHHVGNTLTVTIRENSFTTSVNAVQANLSYNTSVLQFVSADPSAGAFPTALQNTGGSGSVQLGLGTLSGAVTGDQLVATVSFTILTTGSTTVSPAAGCEIYRASDSVNICNQTLGMSYTIT